MQPWQMWSNGYLRVLQIPCDRRAHDLVCACGLVGAVLALANTPWPAGITVPLGVACAIPLFGRRLGKRRCLNPHGRLLALPDGSWRLHTDDESERLVLTHGWCVPALIAGLEFTGEDGRRYHVLVVRSAVTVNDWRRLLVRIRRPPVRRMT